MHPMRHRMNMVLQRAAKSLVKCILCAFAIIGIFYGIYAYMTQEGSGLAPELRTLYNLKILDRYMKERPTELDSKLDMQQFVNRFPSSRSIDGVTKKPIKAIFRNDLGLMLVAQNRCKDIGSVLAEINAAITSEALKGAIEKHAPLRYIILDDTDLKGMEEGEYLANPEQFGGPIIVWDYRLRKNKVTN